MRTYCNLCTVFLLCGLWHGASWNFIVWGLMHGVFLVLERWRMAVLFARLPRIVRHFYLLLFILVSWVIFRDDNLAEAWHYLGAMLGLGTHPQASPWVILKMDSQTAVVVAVSCLLSFPLGPLLTNVLQHSADARTHRRELLPNILSGVKVVSLSFLLLLALMELASGTYNSFIYFRF